MTEVVIADGLVAIGVVREGDHGDWHGYSIDERLICTAPTRQAATGELVKAIRLAHSQAQ